MAFCSQCGNQLADESKFCDKCGAPVGSTDSQSNSNKTKNISDFVEDLGAKIGYFIGAKIADFNNTADYTSEFEQTDIASNKAFAALAYLGILVLIPILAAPNSKFARFHSNQGLALLIVNVVTSIALSIIRIAMYAIADPLGRIISVITWAVGILILVLAIIGIINAVQGKAKELPLIGKIKLLK